MLITFLFISRIFYTGGSVKQWSEKSKYFIKEFRNKSQNNTADKRLYFYNLKDLLTQIPLRVNHSKD